MCFDTMPREKDISTGLKEAIMAVQTVKPFPNNLSLNSTVEKIRDSCTSLQEWMSKVRLGNS